MAPYAKKRTTKGKDGAKVVATAGIVHPTRYRMPPQTCMCLDLEEGRISQNLNKQIRGFKVTASFLYLSVPNIPVHVRKQNFQVQEDSAHLGGINSIKYFYFAKLNSVICMYVWQPSSSFRENKHDFPHFFTSCCLLVFVIYQTD